MTEELKRLISVDVLVVLGLVIVSCVVALRGDLEVAKTVVAGLLGYIGRAGRP